MPNRKLTVPGSDHTQNDVVANWRDDPGSLVVPAEKHIPLTYCLYQNFPNPFNAETTISFDLPDKNNIELPIFNCKGEKVATLISKKMSTGKHKITWQANNLASGIYVYCLKSKKFCDTKKLILIK